MIKGTVILVCGKVGSGKTYYANEIKNQRSAVVLSCDKLMLALFGDNLGVRHNTVLNKTKAYLYELACDIAESGKDVVLDFGFWEKDERMKTRAFFKVKGFQSELYYIRTTDEIQHDHILKRNQTQVANSYFLDDIVLASLNSKFDEPTADEEFILIENMA